MTPEIIATWTNTAAPMYRVRLLQALARSVNATVKLTPKQGPIFWEVSHEQLLL